MSAPVMLWHLALERFTRQAPRRVPEPDLVMEDPAQIDAYMRAGCEDGFLAHLYYFHALQATPIICPGDRVLDLACGPANQLIQIARLNPEAHFVGLDASRAMLLQAETGLQRSDLSNIELQYGDMTQLDAFADASLDAVVSTMSLHHLPDIAALHATLNEIRRVLKPDGGLYLVDFGRLKRQETRDFFVRDRAELQAPLFTQEFSQSMRAAFSFEELSEACREIFPNFGIYRTMLAPFMIAIRSAERHQMDAARQLRARTLFKSMTQTQRRDFEDFSRLFTYAGFPLACRL